MKKAACFAVLLMLVILLGGCRFEERPLPTKAKAQELFQAHFDEIDAAAALLWSHYAELDALVLEGDYRLHVFSHGWSKDDWRYARTSLTEGEKDQIFAAWSLLDENGCSITYHMSDPILAPTLALHCGYDETGRSFAFYYIRPVEDADDGISPEETVQRRLHSLGVWNPNTFLDWSPLEAEYWYQGTKAHILFPQE